MPTWIKRLVVLSLVVTFMGYSMYVYTAGTSVSQVIPLDARVSAGQRLYQEYNCTACHQVYGLGGYLGPDLTNVIFAAGKGPLYAQVFIRNGTARMPNFHLTGEQVDDVIAFLTYVDASGRYPTDKNDVHWYGIVEAANE